MSAEFKVNKYDDADGIYLGISNNGTSYGVFLTLEEIVHLKEVIENATI